MENWLEVQRWFLRCSRGAVLRRMLTQKWLTLSGLAFGLYLVLGVGAVITVPLALPGWWPGLALAVLVPVLGLLGGLVLEDRAAVLFADETAGAPELVNRYRRGFLGVRYAWFRENLQDADLWHPAVLESALRCADAELELHRRGLPTVAVAPAWLALAVAAGSGAVAPFLGDAGLDSWALAAAVAAGVLALALFTWRAAQPSRSGPEELRCLLVWALEDAHADTP